MPIIQMPQQAVPRNIETVDFMSRLTDDEAVAIDLASIGDTIEAALIRRYTRFMTRTYKIDLDSSVVRDGINLLVEKNLLSVERAATILS